MPQRDSVLYPIYMQTQNSLSRETAIIRTHFFGLDVNTLWRVRKYH